MSDSSSLLGSFVYGTYLSRHFKENDVRMQVLPEAVIYSGQITDENETYYFSFSQMRKIDVCRVQVHSPRDDRNARRFFTDWVKRPIAWYYAGVNPEESKMDALLDEFIDELLD